MESPSTIGTPRRVKYVRIGNSGLKVSQIILGCMLYGSKEWRPWILEEEEAIKHINYDAGIQTFDTANMYSNGMGEVVLGNTIKKLGLLRMRSSVRGAVGKTPGTNSMELFLVGPDNVGYVNQHGLSCKHIFGSIKASLKRLQLDYIDMQALHDVVQAGFVRYIGMCSCHAWQYYAITHNLTPFISMQNQYSLVYREDERKMLPSLKHFGVGSIPWSPLGHSALTRPYTGPNTTQKTVCQGSNEIPPDTYFLLGAGNKDVVARVEEIAKKHNVTMAQVSLAWLMAKEEVTAPIVGTMSLEKLEDLIGALMVKLSAEDMKYLEEPYKAMKIMMYI
ncbi:Aldo/keto reductase [Mycena epipterygia]|nr:Aldo/keto reductase [Mycena epipterygia]